MDTYEEQQEHISDPDRDRDRDREQQARSIEDELQEDEVFLVQLPPNTPAATDNNDDEAGMNDKELEEDDTFFIAHTAASDADGPGHAQGRPLLQPEDVDNPLEEDPAFLVASLGGQPQLSQLAQTRTTHGNVNDDDDDDLPSVSQVYGNVTNQEKHRLDVSNLHLGQKNDPQRAIGATTYSGHRIVFERKLGNRMIGQTPALGEAGDTDPKALAKLALTLLDAPVHVLMERIEADINAKALAVAQAALAGSDKPAMMLAPAAGSKHTARKAKGKGRDVDGDKETDTRTWPDRYKPKLFTELLGDERTHRQAMSWLKEWDSCVFRSTQSAAARKKASMKRARDAASAAASASAGGAGSGPGLPGASESTDAHHRPQDKILLLTGPPGLGKTTLAHVIAAQAGYRVQEINASDDRTAGVVRDRIRQSLETSSISNYRVQSGPAVAANLKSRPTCLIIDEIDGAGGGDAGFIRTLVKLIQDGSKPPSKAKGGKGKKDSPPLLRPIICICNDLYAPALRPLRTMARIVRFHPPTTAHLTKRLRAICDIEGLKADNKTLTTLVEVAEGDMRSCLNTLQIVRTQSDTLHEKMIRSTALGLKDTATSVTAVWDKLFRTPSKKRQKGIEEAIGDKYVSPLVKDISTCGEYDKLAQTCFESYLKVKSPADGLKAINAALEWLGHYDRFDQQLRTAREYDIMPYIPYTFVAWNPLFASVANKTPEWPKVDYEMYLQRTAHQEIADALAKSLPLTLKNLFTSTSVACELAPSLVRILLPDLRPVNQQLIKADDRLVLKTLVQQMADLGVSYQPDRNEDGQIVYKLEPQLDAFAHWDGKRAPDLPPARFNLRQLVAKELEAEMVRRGGSAAGVDGAGGKNMTREIGDVMKAYKATAKGGQLAGGANGAPPPVPVALDFFGRPILPKVLPAPAVDQTNTNGNGDIGHSDQENRSVENGRPAKRQRKEQKGDVKVFYKFHEGFSNAVRTNIRVTDLFR